MKPEDKNITAFKNEKLSALFKHSMELITAEALACSSRLCACASALLFIEVPYLQGFNRLTKKMGCRREIDAYKKIQRAVQGQTDRRKGPTMPM